MQQQQQHMTSFTAARLLAVNDVVFCAAACKWTIRCRRLRVAAQLHRERANLDYRPGEFCAFGICFDNIRPSVSSLPHRTQVVIFLFTPSQSIDQKNFCRNAYRPLINKRIYHHNDTSCAIASRVDTTVSINEAHSTVFQRQSANIEALFSRVLPLQNFLKRKTRLRSACNSIEAIRLSVTKC